MAKDIQNWNPEDPQEWAATGKSIATRNLWISIPSLLCGFAVWLYWGIITVQMLNLGFPYAKSELFSLAAIAGLSGATLRIPSTFFIRIAGGRNTGNAAVAVPAAGTPVRHRRRQLRLVHVQHQLLLPQEPAGPGPRPERRPGQLRRDHDADPGSAQHDLRDVRRRIDDPAEFQRDADRQNPRRHRNLPAQCGLRLAVVPGTARICRLVRDEQHP